MDTLYPLDQNGNPQVLAVPLSKGYTAMIDAEDADLAQLRWHASGSAPNHLYARRTVRLTSGPKKQYSVAMHCIVLERKLGRPILPGMFVDHINGDALDNRRENLREVTPLQNQHNKKAQSQVSHGYKGAIFDKSNPGKPWMARIRIDGITRYLGIFATPEEAAREYDQAAKKFFGEYARLNFPEERKQELVTPQIVTQARTRYKDNPSPAFQDPDDPQAFVIPIAKGYAALVSIEDADLAQWRWSVRSIENPYPLRRFRDQGKSKELYMHRVILERKLGRPVHAGLHVDHINGNPLDNRRVNLREATIKQNQHNSKPSSLYGYKGISYHKVSKKWEPRVRIDGKSIWLGAFTNPEDAAREYDKAALVHYGEYARLNFPREDYENV
jgi:hypothetical protein